MIILDTTIVSELLRRRPNARVLGWTAAQAPETLFLTTVTEARLRLGLAMAPSSAAVDGLAEVIDTLLREDFRGRILPFDSAASIAYARVAAERAAEDREIVEADCQIAAIALANGAALATRNGSEFSGCGLRVIDPWDGV